MKQLFANNARTTITTNINAIDLIINLADGSKFPSPGPNEYFLATLVLGSQVEIIKVTSRTGNVLTGITRGYEGTTAASFSTGSRIECRITMGTLYRLDNYFSEIPTLDTMVAPAASENGGYICGNVDPTGVPVILIKSSDTTWKSLNYSSIHTGTIATSTTTSIHASTLPTSSLVAGKYLVQITSGALSGYCRELITADSSDITWTNALPSSPGPGVTFEIFEANTSIYSNADSLAAHLAAADPHPIYMTAAETADVMAAHVAASDPHPTYTTAAELAAGIAAHAAASDPHPTYTTAAELAAGISAHEAAADPHPVYMTSAEDAAIMAAHVAASDPHPTYTTAAELSAAISAAGGLGIGQTWQVVTGSRPYDTSYRNVSGKPIMINVEPYGTYGSTTNVQCSVFISTDNSTWIEFRNNVVVGTSAYWPIFIPLPDQHYYKYTHNGQSVIVRELR